VNPGKAEEIEANLDRARESLDDTATLLETGHPDFACLPSLLCGFLCGNRSPGLTGKGSSPGKKTQRYAAPPVSHAEEAVSCIKVANKYLCGGHPVTS